MKIKRIGKVSVSVILILALVVPMLICNFPANAEETGTTYYIDSENGNDSNDGKSENTPWKTFKNVNDKTTFKPGDRILLKRGSVFIHTFSGVKSEGALILASSGTEDNPIIIGSYGEGPKPVIHANGAYAAIRVKNQQYFIIQDLEITNYRISDPDDFLREYWRRSGIWISTEHQGTKKGIIIRNMTIRDINGMSVTGETTVTTVQGDKNVNKNANAGILINAWHWDNSVPEENRSRYEDILLENNYIYNVAGPGISIDGHMQKIQYYNRNVVVGGNFVNNTGADGIIVGVSDSPVVEYNVSYNAGRYGNGSRWIGGMWFWRTNEGLMQYNEVGYVHAREKAHSDSTAFDTDLATTGDHIYQYNYSHNNEGGFFMDMGRLVNGKNILRYNISVNDRRDAFRSTIFNTTDPGLYYNNIFYNDEGVGFAMKENPRVMFINNIFYYTSDENGEYIAEYPESGEFYYNAFYGQPAPEHAKGSIIGDPMFVDPGNGTDFDPERVNDTLSGNLTNVLRDLLQGYKLQENSTLIGAGKAIRDNGGKDFWGNSLYSGRADIGPYELPGSTAGVTGEKPSRPEVIINEVLDTSIRISANAFENGIPMDIEVYDSGTDSLVAATIADNNCTIENLAPDTTYTFYIKVRNAEGNASDKSDDFQVTTRKSIFLDDSDGVKTGSNWTVSTTDLTSFDGDCSRASAGDGSSTLTWNLDIPETGYYSIYAWFTRGGSDRAKNAPFTVYSAGKAKTYRVDQTPLEPGWRNIGIQLLTQGTDGYIRVSNDANGIVTADAVKLVYIEEYSFDEITEVKISADRVQIGIGDTSNLTVTGIDALGRQIDLVFNGAEVEYVVDNPEIARVENGVVTGMSKGSSYISARLNLNGRQVTSNEIEIIVGDVFEIREPVFTNADGEILTSLCEGTVNTSVRIVNSTENKLRVTLIVSLYSPEGLVTYGTDEKAVYENSIVDFNVSLTMPEDITGHYLRVFVWDSMSTIRPLTDAFVWPD